MVQTLVDVTFDHIPRKRPTEKILEHIQVISHRGKGSWTGPGYEENTVSAFKNALSCGVWGIECDLRWTRDNVPVILHDTNTRRVFGKNVDLGEATFEDLRSQVPEVPLLEEVLDVFKSRVHLMLEIKEPLTEAQNTIFEKMISGWKPVEEFHLMSLRPEILEGLTEVPSGALVSIAELKRQEIHQNTVKNQWGGYTGHYLLTTNPMLRVCQAAGVKCGTGFVNSESVLYREAARGVDWVFTDQTDRIMKIISRTNREMFSNS